MPLLLDYLRAYAGGLSGVDGVRRAMVARRLCDLASDPTLLALYGLNIERFDDLVERRSPLAFKSPEQFQEFIRDMSNALQSAGLAGSIRIIGTSTSLFSMSPDKAPNTSSTAMQTRRVILMLASKPVICGR